jgi:hypothetical protein
MYYSAVSAEYVDGYRLRVGFEDGTTAVVDLEPYARRGGVFRKLADLRFFKRFKINADFGVICWGRRGDVDIAPETLYELAGGARQVARVAEQRAVYGRRRRDLSFKSARTAAGSGGSRRAAARRLESAGR